MTRVALIASLVCLTALACTEPRSATCREVCKREADCVEELGSKLQFDLQECVAACAALEQDVEHSAAKVQRHADCVRHQTSCAGVLECK